MEHGAGRHARHGVVVRVVTDKGRDERRGGATQGCNCRAERAHASTGFAAASKRRRRARGIGSTGGGGRDARGEDSAAGVETSGFRRAFEWKTER